MSEQERHRNDLYGQVNPSPEVATEAIPAATVVLLRDCAEGPEVLMLHRTSRVHFAGMWVFPGGRIDPGDYPAGGDLELAARNAAARESLEEANIHVRPEEFVCFSHWTPPPGPGTRYATWFFATEVGHGHAIDVDGEEIQDHDWTRPAQALRRHAAGEIDLAAPTWVTLDYLRREHSCAAILGGMKAAPRRVYQTHIGVGQDGVRVAMWSGDAGYDEWNPDLTGARHRLVMDKAGFRFENNVDL